MFGKKKKVSLEPKAGSVLVSRSESKATNMSRKTGGNWQVEFEQNISRKTRIQKLFHER